MNAIPGSSSTMLGLSAGDVWYFWFQYLDPNGAAPPEHGTVVRGQASWRGGREPPV